MKSDEKGRAERYAEAARDFCHITRALEEGIPIDVSLKKLPDDEQTQY